MFNNEIYSIILPARVVSFDETNQTAEVKISAERVTNNSTEDRVVTVRETIQGVPVHVLSGGGWAITMPIKAGDTCVMFFSQVGYDHWLYEDKDEGGLLSGVAVPHLNRQFHEDDGYALVGLNTIPRAITGYSAVDSQWRNADKTQIIDLKENGDINITGVDEVTIVSDTKTILTAPDIELTGNVKITGTLEVTETLDVTGETTLAALDAQASTLLTANIGGKPYLLHTHTSAAPGSPTGPPL